MKLTAQIVSDLKEVALPEKAEFFPNFFKTGKGQYAEGDLFLGVTVPFQRKIAKTYWKDINASELQELIHSPFHEVRLTSIFMLVLKYEKSKSIIEKEKWVGFYLKNKAGVNNWDLVDSSAFQILGAWLFDKNRDLLFELAHANNLWDQRISIMSTFYFIKRNDFQTTLQLAEILLNHPHDLIHKAVGWMLREIGNRDLETARDFVLKYIDKMPRTMLRYAIEKYEEDDRKMILSL
ncbi:DNA alkylation repair protein [Belliella sp. R4-6]|uniref:DNA alkylation repair protein n=1 Tax=Belliella alkalica TaxID=1730871 RepID=A0ABS9VA66_9BACT|nr:DNA alkylation repair protein [Belliella alkalica]MCH7413301.1 DNA alkylation repair protein [Belliella alkalica]